MDYFRQLLNGIRQAWSRLTPSARINIVVAAVLTIALVAGLSFLTSQPQYVRLYSQLDQEDSSAIQTYLREEANVAYKLQNEGQTILVPVGKVQQLKTALIERGIPQKQGVAPGFELFEKQDLMANRWLQDVKYMRAIQGELERQLNEFDFVKRSFVFIREAKEELFTSDQKPSEAAVTLDVTRPLSKSEIKTVLGIISSFGGANLNPNNITLTTTDGTPLHVPPTSEFASVANSKLEYIAELEKQREDRALRDLERLGVKAVVRVSAVVDFSSKTIKSSKTEEGTPISEYEQTNTTTSEEALPEGPPGVTANLPTTEVKPGGTKTSEETAETITNYQPSQTDTETTTDPGEVKQYIVSAIVEGDYEAAKDDQGNPVKDDQGNPVRQYAGLKPERKKVYEDYLRAAVGEGQTPTVITVNDHPFELDGLAVAQAVATAAAVPGTVVEYGLDAAKVLLVLAGFLVVRRLFRRAVVVPEPEAPEETVGDHPRASAEDLRREEVAQEIERLSVEQPETVAALLRSWIAEDIEEE